MAKTESFRVRNLVANDGSFQWQGDSQGATNCDDCLYDPDILFEGEFPVEYSCDEFVDENDRAPAPTSVSLDYEALIPNTADPFDNVRELEWSLMRAIVKRIGLEKCDFEPQYDPGQRALMTSLSYPTAIYTINSNPADSIYEPGCLILKDYPATSQCLAIQTKMTIHYRGSREDEAIVQEYLQDIIREKMTTKPQDLLVKDVTDLSYAGDFASIQTSAPAPVLQSNTMVQSSGWDKLPTIISASALVVLCSIFLMLRFGHRWAQAAASCSKSSPDEIQDLEMGSTHSSDASSAVPQSSTSDALENDSGYEMPDCYTPTLLVDTAADDQSDAAVIPMAPPHDSTEAAMAALIAAAHNNLDLPPRPPRRNSMKLKKKRRKKKRKKQSVLKRVNSRENVNQMEAIPESEDEGSEFDGSEGGDSEYSTTDDENSNHSSNQSSSGCLTPRPLPGSRTSSRASSPKLSPQDELFSSDIFSSNYDFIIEAPDFPFDKYDNARKPRHQQQQQQQTHDYSSDNERLQPRKSTASRPDGMVSPIKEENIRPIPPPWV